MSAVAPPRAEPARGQGPLLAPVPAPPRPASWTLPLAGALALALLSLLLPSEPTYDPWAWIVWSREIVEGSLHTTEGPSWKPLPVLLTLPFAALDDDIAPAAWLVMARAGGVLAIVMAYRLGRRLGGPVAGVLAGAFLLAADELVRNVARGNSEGLLVALVLFAVERHLDGRRGPAFALGLAAALLRPEVWPFLGLYGLWLAWREPRRRLGVLGGFALLAALWLGPEWWGSGNPLRASDRARQPNPDSPAFAPDPFADVFRRSQDVLLTPVLVGALLALLAAAREARGRYAGDLRLVFGAGAMVLMLMVGAMTQMGYAGNLRYVALPAALLCALAGAGWVQVVRLCATRAGRPAGVLVAAGLAWGATHWVDDARAALRSDLDMVEREAVIYADLDAALSAAGGAARVRACGSAFTGRFDHTALAWRLHVPLDAVGIFPYGPGTIFATREFSMTRPWPSALGRDERYAPLARTREWIVRASCGAPPTS